MLYNSYLSTSHYTNFEEGTDSTLLDAKKELESILVLFDKPLSVSESHNVIILLNRTREKLHHHLISMNREDGIGHEIRFQYPHLNRQVKSIETQLQKIITQLTHVSIMLETCQNTENEFNQYYDIILNIIYQLDDIETLESDLFFARFDELGIGD